MRNKAIALRILLGAAAICVAAYVGFEAGRKREESSSARKRAREARHEFLNRELSQPDRVSARREVVRAAANAKEAGNHREAAFLNAMLAQEALERAHRTLKVWEQFRNPRNGLLPRDIADQRDLWIARDNASDQFPFFLLASQLLDPPGRQSWLDAMAHERRICGPMPCSLFISSEKVIEEDMTPRIFGASEYAKDGLLAITERLGPGPWMERLKEVALTIVDAAPVDTPRGKIPAATTEVNGNMLQILSRLAWATGNDTFITMAERIAETYLFDIIPANNGLPADDWDFSTGKPVTSVFQFRDHGNEIIPGLSELYFYEKIKGRPQAAKYREPLKALLDLCLTVGRTPDGLWYDRVDITSHEPMEKRIGDNWGYLLNAYAAFDLAEGTVHYTSEIVRTMRAASTMKSFEWEGRSHDGYADSIESMLYALPAHGFPEARLWVDDEIEVMFDIQTSSGIVSGRYLDGNFIRTALLYASYKAQGVTAEPWSPGTRVGASLDAVSGELTLCVDAEPGWNGVIRFDPPRHETIWKMATNYPRLNSTPEWFPVSADATYSVENLATGEATQYSGAELVRGITVATGAGHVYLRVRAAE